MNDFEKAKSRIYGLMCIIDMPRPEEDLIAESNASLAVMYGASALRELAKHHDSMASEKFQSDMGEVHSAACKGNFKSARAILEEWHG